MSISSSDNVENILNNIKNIKNIKNNILISIKISK